MPPHTYIHSPILDRKFTIFYNEYSTRFYKFIPNLLFMANNESYNVVLLDNYKLVIFQVDNESANFTGSPD